jgi:hypothetical protein
MKGFIAKALVVLCCASGSVGCRDCHDPCWPERYNYMARKEVNIAFAPQVQNGHVLDQTVWNYYFEPGTDCLTPLGLDRLAYMARRRPCPDTNVFLQTAQDIVYDPACAEKMVEVRQSLDLRRKAAVERFLVAQTAGRPVAFQIFVHDPAEASVSSTPVNWAVTQMYLRYMGGLMMGGQGGGGQGGGMMGGGGMGGAMGAGGAASVTGGNPGGSGTGGVGR